MKVEIWIVGGKTSKLFVKKNNKTTLIKEGTEQEIIKEYASMSKLVKLVA